MTAAAAAAATLVRSKAAAAAAAQKPSEQSSDALNMYEHCEPEQVGKSARAPSDLCAQREEGKRFREIRRKLAEQKQEQKEKVAAAKWKQVCACCVCALSQCVRVPVMLAA